MSSASSLGSESAQNLISMLRSAFQPSDFDKVQQILVAREESLKRNINDMSKEIEIWKKQFELMEKKKDELESAKLETEDELKKYKRECDDLREQVIRSKEDQKVQSDRARRAEDKNANLLKDSKKAEADKRMLVFQLNVKSTDLECSNATKRRAEGEMEAWKKKFGQLERRLLQLEEDIATLMSGVPLSLQTQINEALESQQPVSDEIIVEKETCDVGKPQNQTGAGNSGPKQSVSNCHEEVQQEDIIEKGTCDDGKSQNETGVGNSSTNLLDTQIKESVSNSHVSVTDPVTEIDGLQLSGPNSMSRACDNEVVIKKELVLDVESLQTSDKLKGSSMGVNKKPEPAVVIEINDSDDEIPVVKEMSKRKRASCSYLSPSEDDDDNTLISKRRTKPIKQLIYGNKTSPGDAYRAMPDSGSIDIAKAVSPPRQRPVLIGRCREKVEAQQNVRNPLSKFIPDEISSDSEDSSSSGDGTCTDSDMNNMVAELWRKRNSEKWAFKPDMLLAFERDSELCMNAICALYRQQNSTKESIKGPLYSENRGFNQFDAIRGTALAKFLTGGDPLGGLKKSVLELQQYDPKGLDDCRRLAKHYATQLFEIYRRKEDPFFS
ncbi:uncharacterized protein LOC132285839 [Cornus florida]|uniref:uncharacterized protein LOC132285839 n=1 Tax=Cornus florida TaxID=4283 RepID=UPI002896DC5E|nr:uncharacterized protein LOC132285839 [Cornus florida]